MGDVSHGFMHPAVMSGMDDMAMSGALGAEPMTQDGSGTSWQPASSPHQGFHLMHGAWSVMLHGDGTLVYDDQGGPRGQNKTFFESMLMGMASRPFGGGELSLHGMVSLDPTIGKSGYPLLLQTGETARRGDIRWWIASTRTIWWTSFLSPIQPPAHTDPWRLRLRRLSGGARAWSCHLSCTASSGMADQPGNPH